MFKDFPYQAVESAVYEYIMSNDTSFPPSPGQIHAIINRTVKEMEEPELSKYEAWDLVVRTMQSGVQYDLDKKFSALPKTVQKAVGNVGNLRSWAMMESGIEYVKNSFLARYQELSEAEEDRKALPEYTAQAIKRLYESETELIAG